MAFPWLTAVQIGLVVGPRLYSMYFASRPEEKRRRPNVRVTSTGKQPGRIIYGKPWATGVYAYANAKHTDTDTTLYLVSALAAHEVHAFHKVRFDGREFTPDWAGQGEVLAGDFAGAVKAVPYYGAASQTVEPTLELEFNEWTTAHRGREVAYTAFQLRLTEDTEELFSNFPNQVHVEVSGKEVYDPRLDTTPGANPKDSRYRTWSANPGLCFADYVTDSLGMDLEPDQVDWDSVEEFANGCDTLAVTNNPIEQAPRFECHGTLLTNAPHQQNIEAILQTALGSCILKNGRLSLVPYAAGTAVPGTWITDSNILDISNEADYRGVAGSYGEWANAESKEYKTVREVGATANKDLQLVMPMVQQEWRAQRIAKALVDQSLSALTVKAQLDSKGKQLFPGDRINVTSKRYGWNSKLFRVLEMAKSTTEGEVVIAKEDSASLYRDPISTFYTQPAQVAASNPEAVTVPPPSDLTATGGQERILLSWTLPTLSNWKAIALSRSETENYTDASWIFVGNANSFTDTDVEVGTTYYYWIAALDYAGRSSKRNPDSDTSNVSATPVGLGVGKPVAGSRIVFTDGNQTIDGLKTFDRGTEPPLAAVAGSGTVEHFTAERATKLVDSQGTEYAPDDLGGDFPEASSGIPGQIPVIEAPARSGAGNTWGVTADYAPASHGTHLPAPSTPGEVPQVKAPAQFGAGNTWGTVNLTTTLAGYARSSHGTHLPIPSTAGSLLVVNAPAQSGAGNTWGLTADYARRSHTHRGYAPASHGTHLPTPGSVGDIPQVKAPAQSGAGNRWGTTSLTSVLSGYARSSHGIHVPSGGSQGQALVRNTQGGLSWSSVASSGHTHSGYAPASHGSHVPSGGTAGQALVLSTQGVPGWSSVASSGHTHSTYALASHGSHVPSGGTAGQALVRNTQGGISWSSVASSGHTHSTYALASHGIHVPSGGSQGQALVRNTQGGLSWSSVASAGHGHGTTYAARSHSHNYAASNHSHNYASTTHGHGTTYAATGHTHDYADSTHTHDYADSTHTHDYAASGHTHNYATVGHGHGTTYAARGHSHNYAATSHGHRHSHSVSIDLADAEAGLISVTTGSAL